MTTEDKLWEAFPTSEPVAAYEIAKCILIWESIRDTEDVKKYLEEARNVVAT